MIDSIGTISSIIKKQKCFGCGACAAICREQAITMEIGREGFFYPKINLELCRNCGLCLNVCPSAHPGLLFDINKGDSFALWAKNSKIRLLTSSGGAAFQFALKYFTKGYLPIGAVFKDNFRYVEHIVAKAPEDILSTVGSKYIQSNTENAFRYCLSNPNGKYIAFGTPCQINAFRNIIGQKDFDDYLLIDLFCHGVPSYHLWWAFVEEISRKTGRLQHVEIRNKARGWHKYGVLCIGDRGIYEKNFLKTTFGRFYLSNYCLNEPCYKCTYGRKSAADLRVGDFWGKEYADNLMGVSLAVALSDKGLQLIEETEGLAFRSIPLSLLFDSQKRVKKPKIAKPKNNERLMEDLISGQPLPKAYKRHLSSEYRKKGLRHFPYKLANAILPKRVKSILRFAIRALRS